MARRNIRELLQVPEQGHDLAWLKEALGWAIELEFATIPPYLCGLWSIKPEDGHGPADRLVKSVVMEEMLHFANACNMLRAIGGEVTITPPTYPGPLPGGVAPHLRVHLAGLSDDTLCMYMAIEQPEQMPPTADGQTFPTIGAFYDAISRAFRLLPPPPISGTGQIPGEIPVPDPDKPNDPTATIMESFAPLRTVQDVLDAIELIKDQGEGTGTSPNAPQFDPPDGELAHYFRFGEILNGKQYRQTDGHWGYTGDPVPFPHCYPVAEIPVGGYPGVPEVAAFDAQFQTVLFHLQNAWTGTGSPDELGAAIAAMDGLSPLAKEIVKIPIPGGQANYGPDFVPHNATAQT
jgi:ferritin-like protein